MKKQDEIYEREKSDTWDRYNAYRYTSPLPWNMRMGGRMDNCIAIIQDADGKPVARLYGESYPQVCANGHYIVEMSRTYQDILRLIQNCKAVLDQVQSGGLEMSDAFTEVRGFVVEAVGRAALIGE